MKVYTKKGDGGKTSLVDGTPIEKGDLRLEAYGTSDELNSFLGLLVTELKNPELEELLPLAQKIQNNLFVVGGQLACSDPEMAQKLPRLDEKATLELERNMDQWDQSLPPLKNFILPGGTKAASLAHVCRTITRRLERACVRLQSQHPLSDNNIIPYINRLSDLFFLLSRYCNFKMGISSPIWKA